MDERLDDNHLIKAACKHDLIEPVGIHIRCYSCGIYLDDYSNTLFYPEEYRDSLMDEYLEKEIGDEL